MVGRKRGDIPKALARGRDRFEEWRRTRKIGARIPDKLWSLAAKLADAHGLSRTASALKLDYHSLKKRVAARSFDSAPQAFIEGSSGNLVAVVRHEIELAAIEEDACAIVCEVAKASGG